MGFVIVDTDTDRPLRRENGLYYRTSGGMELPAIFKTRFSAERRLESARKKGRMIGGFKGNFEVRRYR